MNIIALGASAITCAESFKRYPQYKIFNIGLDKHHENMFIKLKGGSCPEDYESLTPSMMKKIRKIDGESMFVVCGTSVVASASLVILEQLVKNTDKISILYLRPDVQFASETEKLQERVVRCVLQEYSRSNFFKEILLVDSRLIEKYIPPVSIAEHYSAINDYIVDVIHTLNIFRNTKPVFTQAPEISEICKIGTLAIQPLEEKAPKMFYSLENVREIRYYFGIGEEKISEPTLKEEIFKFLRENSSSNSVGYYVFPGSGAENFVISIFFSSEPEMS